MKPNILFLLLDSLRGDKCYGERKSAITPNIDKLIKNGIYFSQTIGSSDYTGPAIQSIFTARFPFGCGKSKESYYKIYSKSTSYLTLLKDNGYHAYAIMHSSLGDQGLYEPFENTDLSHKESENIHNGLGERILSKLKDNSMLGPWFYYVHFMDLHKPCIVPEKFQNLSESERYDHNLEVIDEWIGKMMDTIDFENTLVILTADHGDYISMFDVRDKEKNPLIKNAKSIAKSLIPKKVLPTIHEKKKELTDKMNQRKLQTPHEKRMFTTRPMGKRFFFDDVVNVPLIFSGYTLKPTKPINQQIGSIDIFPTVLDLLTIPENSSKVNGRSLLPLIKNEKFNSIPIYMESSITKTQTINPQPAVGIRTPEYKYFRQLDNADENVHLYDLQKDPFEDFNLASERPDLIKNFENILQDVRKDIDSFSEETETLSKKEEEELEAELKKLGYI